ncbi:MAG: GH3 auxin-responsive promoter family protein, partial [Chitinophagales bacterium]
MTKGLFLHSIMLNSILKIYLKKRAQRFAYFSDSPEKIQQAVLEKILNSASKTAFAKKYVINSNTSYKEFQQQVPFFTYDALKPFIEKAIAGESSVLWPGKLKWLAKSSGTSSDRSKYIPVTDQFLNDTLLQGGRDALALYTLQRPNHKLFKGKGLIMGGSHELVKQNHQIRTGDISAVMMQNMPAIARYFLTPNLQTALLGNWEQKLEAMLQCGKEKVSNISGVPTWTLVLIRQLLKKYNAQNLSKVWPKLELYIHGGVNFQPYRDEFEHLMGKKIDFLEVYNASEG